MKNKATEKYSVVPAAGQGVDVYKDAILGLWRNNLADIPAERFAWLYSRNPCGPALSWLALHRTPKEVVGIGSLYPRRVLVNGREFRVGIAIDFAIDKNHRVLGPALMIQKAIAATSRASGFQFTYAYPNSRSYPIFRHVGYRLLGEARNCVKPLRIEKRVAEYIRIGFLAKSAALLAERYFRIRDRVHTALLPFDLVPRVLPRADERFDALWEELKSHYRVAGEKTSSFLNWRYTGITAGPCYYFCLFSRDEKHLKGYLVYTIKDDIAVVLDLLAADTGKVCEYLFLSFSGRMRKENISLISLSFFGRERFLNRLRGLGFFTRKAKRSFFIFSDHIGDPAALKTIADKENWLLFEGDMDL